jgi:Gram-negative bacterial TonB protein C-terminal
MPNPCGGYFPASAKADHGRVRVHVRVDQAGRASVTRVLTELPGGQDFGSAARACAAALRFAPATDQLGTPVAGDAKLELSFHRS